MSTALSRKRVRVIYTGGRPAAESSTLEAIHTQIAEYLRLQLVADTELTVIQDNRGSSIDWSITDQIGEDIMKHYDEYDGFVVVHGIDQAEYIGSLLALRFKQLGKPVVFTGYNARSDSNNKQPSEHFSQLEFRTNLLTAVQVATLDCRGVLLAYGAHVVRALRAVSDVQPTLPFVSHKEPAVAKVQFGVELTNLARPRTKEDPIWLKEYAQNIRIIDVYPGLDLETSLSGSEQALIIKSGRQYGLPSVDMLPTDIPIIVYGKGDLTIKQDNIIKVDNITIPAAIAKIMVSTQSGHSIDQVLATFTENSSGEFF